MKVWVMLFKKPFFDFYFWPLVLKKYSLTLGAIKKILFEYDVKEVKNRRFILISNVSFSPNKNVLPKN
jgi:hypothetical protein